MDTNKWTQKTQEGVTAAVDMAKERSNPEVTPDHLALALLGQAEGITLPIMAKLGLSPLSLKNQIGDRLEKLPRAYGAEPQLSRQLLDVLRQADLDRQEMRDDYLSVEHILLGLATNFGTDRAALLTALREVRGTHRVTTQNPEESFQALEKYGRDLTEAARRHKIDPVIGRDEEIRRVVQVLSR
ncbi:MAG: type VI secretion system ATPase TssH, partial [Actinomycetota bacterium]|nr:type VI secretion system ATPase TssH [Actinomycetota bacterium]